MVASRLRNLVLPIALFFALASTTEARPSNRDALPNIRRNWPSGGSGLSGYSVPLSDGKYEAISSTNLTSAAIEALQ